MLPGRSNPSDPSCCKASPASEGFPRGLVQGTNSLAQGAALAWGWALPPPELTQSRLGTDSEQPPPACWGQGHFKWHLAATQMPHIGLCPSTGYLGLINNGHLQLINNLQS